MECSAQIIILAPFVLFFFSSQNTPCFVCTILSCLKQQNAHVVDNRFAASESANSRHNLLPYIQFVILSSE